MSKGSGRRKEDAPRVRENLAKVDHTKRDKSKDTFKVRVNGKVVEK